MDAKATGLNRTLAVSEAVDLLARLRAPGGCAWDREQTFDSIKAHTLEETYEVFDAIERRDWPNLKEELGDLLLQVLFYAQMAEEKGLFSIEDVAATLNEKLIRRHPHIFSDAVASTSADVKRNWETIKQNEKLSKGSGPVRFMDSVPRHAPALTEATKLGSRAAEASFDWPHTDDILEKIGEETAELQAEIELAAPSIDAQTLELGDLLFTVANLARHLQINPEFALRAANQKFRDRFNAMEFSLGGTETLYKATPEELDRSWKKIKEAVKT